LSNIHYVRSENCDFMAYGENFQKTQLTDLFSGDILSEMFTSNFDIVVQSEVEFIWAKKWCWKRMNRTSIFRETIKNWFWRMENE
jgi:hypothetical protein